MKLRNIPDYFETHRHKDSGLCQRVYIDKYKTNEASSSLFEKEKNAISLLKKEDARLFKKSLIVVFIGLAIFVIGLFVCRTVEHLGAGMQYTLGLMIPFFINFFIAKMYISYEKKQKMKPYYLGLKNDIERCRKNIATSLCPPKNAINVDIGIKEIIYKNGKKHPFSEPTVQNKSCYLYKEDNCLCIIIEGCLYKVPFPNIKDFVLDTRSTVFFGWNKSDELFKKLSFEYDIVFDKRYGGCYVTRFCAVLTIEENSKIYKIVFLPYEADVVGDFLGIKAFDPTIPKGV